MHDKDLILGIDTSNYKTSVAVVDNRGNIICDLRRLLTVKQGEKGLRQSYALFQHVERLPGLLAEALGGLAGSRVAAVAVSVKPRPQEGSYMPVFRAGEGFGRAVAAALSVPLFSFSHQEGHIEAIKRFSSFADESEFLTYHLSGGTCELLHVRGKDIRLIGGSLDISFGQLLDRIGVSLGLAFPAGEALDERASGWQGGASAKLKKIPTKGLSFNLSGMETQCLRILEHENEAALLSEVFDKIAECLETITLSAVRQTGADKVLFTGGVSSSRSLSRRLLGYFNKKEVRIEFGDQRLSQDNAVGIALLGGNEVWQLNR